MNPYFVILKHKADVEHKTEFFPQTVKRGRSTPAEGRRKLDSNHFSEAKPDAISFEEAVDQKEIGNCRIDFDGTESERFGRVKGKFATASGQKETQGHHVGRY